MGNVITGTFVKRRYQDSGRDQSPDYYVYEFTNISDPEGNKFSDAWIKHTKLLENVPFRKGVQYQITLSVDVTGWQSRSFPYPLEVSWKHGKVYRKNGNSIIKVDENGNETNLSIPLSRLFGKFNH